MAKRALIYDVAAAAAVSVSTVSNVMNRPSTVAGPTRARVLLVISELGYERDENAALLRLGKKVIRRQPPSGLPARDPVPKVTPPKETDVGPADGETSALLTQDWRKIPLSGAVQVASYGQDVGGGIVEASLLDGSGAWVRFDDGRGRLLLMQEDGYSLCSKIQAK
jgi:hypothetical protein